MKNQKGITLIALVITIIVLLILAGITIAMLTGENGLLNKANSAKAETVKAEAVEKINVTLNDIKTEIYKQQVKDSAYTPIKTVESSTTLDTAISTLLTKDGVVGAEAENVYWYTFDSTSTNKTLTISYKNTASEVSTISGTINLNESPWTINPAPVSGS